MSSECPNVLRMSDPEDPPPHYIANTGARFDSVVNTALFAHTYVDVVKKTPTRSPIVTRISFVSVESIHTRAVDERFAGRDSSIYPPFTSVKLLCSSTRVSSANTPLLDGHARALTPVTMLTITSAKLVAVRRAAFAPASVFVELSLARARGHARLRSGIIDRAIGSTEPNRWVYGET